MEVWDIAHKNVVRSSEPVNIDLDSTPRSARAAALELLGLQARSQGTSRAALADFYVVPMRVLGLGEFGCWRAECLWDRAVLVLDVLGTGEGT